VATLPRESDVARNQQTQGLGEAIAVGVAVALGKLLADIRDFVPDSQRPFVHRRADRLAAELLAYAGRQELVPAAVEPLPLLRSMADRLGGALDHRIEVVVEVERDCAACHADARALADALLRLVANARDAMPDGGCLRLSAHGGCRLRDDSPAVALSVSDSGGGMTADVAERAAWPFFTTKTNDPWAGMGLPAVEGFARQSGGSMAVQSSPNAGTTVTLYLPSFALNEQGSVAAHASWAPRSDDRTE
jgi:signal transduction histidine kinase